MSNNDRNTKPGDNEIVTKKGFLITPPGKNSQNKAKNGGNSQDKDGKKGLFGKKNSQPQKNDNAAPADKARSEKKKNDKPARHTEAPREEIRGERNDDAQQNGGKNRSKNRHRKNNKKPQGERPVGGSEAKNRAPEKQSKNDGNVKNEKKTPRDNSKANGGNKRKNSGILSELGFVSDSFLKKSGFDDKLSEQEPEEKIDYSKAIPLRDQIYPPKTDALAPESTEGKLEIIGVRFKEAGKIYYFDPNGKNVPYGTPVIVETARGLEYGFTAISNRFIPVDTIVAPLKKIIRIATKDDKDRLDANKSLEEEAGEVFKEKVEKLGLEMSLVGVEYTFDNTKLLFYFVAEGRVDFRELVKDLAAVFHTRIELRQVGVRDEAKMMGGLGVCGRTLCCQSFLGEFAQVSIKMAKDQNLSLNSAKISGTCGRLLCCLRYEDEVYQKEYERTPKVDAIVETPEGKGTVVEANPLKGTVRVRLDDRADSVPQAFHRDSVKIIGYNHSKEKQEDSELKELEKE